MENRITTRLEDMSETQNRRSGDAHPIGEILEELFGSISSPFSRNSDRGR